MTPSTSESCEAKPVLSPGGRSSLRHWLKILVTVCFVMLLLPSAILSGFGRINLVFTFFAHAWALIPGIVGDYVRVAYYMLTLRSCSWECQVCFGSYFAHPEATVARFVGIGPYCVVGRVAIGERTKIGTATQIVSGQQQHRRDPEGRLTSEGGVFTEVVIGSDCWIGVSCVIAADVGPGANLAAGSVVLTPVPPGAVMAGNPARKFLAECNLIQIKPRGNKFRISCEEFLHRRSSSMQELAV